MATTTIGGSPADRECLEQDVRYLLEFLDTLWDTDAIDLVRDALEDRDTPAICLVTECVMARVRQRLRDGYWDHAWYERWLHGPAATEEPA